MTDPDDKETRRQILKPYSEGQTLPYFVYRSPIYEREENGSIKKNEDGTPKMQQPPRDKYHSEFIIQAFKHLWYNRTARWKDVSTEKITLPQLAFVLTLVCYLDTFMLSTLF